MTPEQSQQWHDLIQAKREEICADMGTPERPDEEQFWAMLEAEELPVATPKLLEWMRYVQREFADNDYAAPVEAFAAFLIVNQQVTTTGRGPVVSTLRSNCQMERLGGSYSLGRTVEDAGQRAKAFCTEEEQSLTAND